MFEMRTGSRQLLVLGTVSALSMMLSGCSKSDSDSSCHEVFTAGLFSQSCQGNLPTNSNLQESDALAAANSTAAKNIDGADDPKFLEFNRNPDGTRTVALNGYNVVTWDPRGEFDSGGILHLDSPFFEGRDISDLIDRFRNRD